MTVTDEMISAGMRAYHKHLDNSEVLDTRQAFAEAFVAALAAAPTLPAQEVEPIYQVYLAFDKWRDVDQHIYDALTLPKRIVYTHPQSDEIRKAAERRLSAWEGEEGSLPWRLNRLSEEIDNLRAALEGK